MPSPQDDLPGIDLNQRRLLPLSLHETGWEHAIQQLDALC